MDYTQEPHGVFFMIDNKSFYASVECVQRGLDPLKAKLVVMSQAPNTNGGLVLSASPQAKKSYGLKNVDRYRDLPQTPDLLVVPPRMALYVTENKRFNHLLHHFAAEEDCLPYSIDETLVDMTHSWSLFGATPREVAHQLHDYITTTMGLCVTIGIGDNPTQAKFALDLWAKYAPDFVAELHYETVQAQLWPITELTKVWGIGPRLAHRLSLLGIESMQRLAQANPYWLKEKLGLIGTQLYASAWGIDRTDLRAQRQPQERSFSQSQILPRDYEQAAELETILKEMTLQMTQRLHSQHLQTGQLHLFWRGSRQVEVHPASHHYHLKLGPTDRYPVLVEAVLALFQHHWQQEAVRQVGVSFGRLGAKTSEQLTLFSPDTTVKEEKLARTQQQLQARFGPKAMFRGTHLTAGSTYLTRQGLIGGHQRGND